MFSDKILFKLLNLVFDNTNKSTYYEMVEYIKMFQSYYKDLLRLNNSYNDTIKNQTKQIENLNITIDELKRINDIYRKNESYYLGYLKKKLTIKERLFGRKML